MTDTKKPKLSEIRASLQWTTLTEVEARENIAHLLELVRRLGKMTNRLIYRHHDCGHSGALEDCPLPKCREAHALIKELEL